jgi:hypothetical protein
MGGLSGEEQSQQAKNVASTLLQQPARAALWRVLDPRGPFHLFWDMLLLIQLAYLVVQVPFVVCFGVTYRWALYALPGLRKHRQPANGA